MFIDLNSSYGTIKDMVKKDILVKILSLVAVSLFSVTIGFFNKNVLLNLGIITSTLILALSMRGVRNVSKLILPSLAIPLFVYSILNNNFITIFISAALVGLLYLKDKFTLFIIISFLTYLNIIFILDIKSILAFITIFTFIATIGVIRANHEGFKSVKIANYLIVPVLIYSGVTNISKWGSNNLLDSKRLIFISMVTLSAVAIFLLTKSSSKNITIVSSMVIILSLIATSAPFISIFEKKTEKNYSDIEQIKNYVLPGVGYKDYLRGKSFKECDQGGTTGRDCFITYYVDLAKKKGLDFAIKDIIDAVNSGRGVTLPAVCHQVTHKLGELAGETTYKNDILGGLKIEPQVCATGFTHGILTDYWSRYNNQELSKMAGTACEELNLKGEYYRWTCNHILGHELVLRDELKPGEQLRACLSIENQKSKEDCLSGGWMQFFSDDPILSMFIKVKARPSTVFSYCDKEVTESQRMCYQETFPTLIILTGADFPQMLNICSLAKDKVDKTWCIQGVGRGIAISNNYTTEMTTKICNKVTGDTRDYCLASSAASITLNTGSTLYTYPMCKLIADKDIKNYCNNWVRDSRKLIASGPNIKNMPQI